MTSPSYRKSECCGGCDCDFLDDEPEQPCYGQVDMTSSGDDEDGWPFPNHCCQGHIEVYERQYDKNMREYIPEKTQ